MRAQLAVFGAAFGTTLLVTPSCSDSRRFGAVVRPDDRRVHQVPTPTLGGFAMLAGFLAAMLVAWRLDFYTSVFDSTTEPLGVALAAVVIFSVGLFDDVREMSAPAKTAGMVLAGTILSVSGVTILFFRSSGTWSCCPPTSRPS